VDGMRLPNPFVIGSGPPGTNYTARAAPRHRIALSRCNLTSR
jgi:hypothetical protein